MPEREMPLKVAHVGNLHCAAYQNCKYLRELGVEADLYITYLRDDGCGQPIIDPTEDPRVADDLNEWPDWVKTWKIRPRAKPFAEQRRLLASYDLVHAYTVTPVFLQFSRKVLISHCTGSDLREMAPSRGLMGWLLRRAYRRSEAVLFTDCDTWTLRAIEQIGLRNTQFVHTVVDLDIFRPGPEKALRRELLQPGEVKLAFAPARQNWHDKGNDVLLRAFARLAARRSDVRLVARSWGIDGERASALAADLAISHRVTFVGELDRREMARYYRAADVVAGLFVSGTSGFPHFPLMIQESLACGVPTVTYCDDRLCQVAFGAASPYFLAVDEADLPRRLEEALSGGPAVDELVTDGLRWARARLPGRSVGESLLRVYSEIIPRQTAITRHAGEHG
jgi:glycosyltransferase involved in cell wall biosynthesis